MVGLLVCLALPSAAFAGSITIAWDASPASEAVQGYRVYVGTSPGNYTVPGSPFDVVGASTTQFTFTAATTGVTYYFAVAAYNAGGEGPRSAAVSGVTSSPTVTITTPTSAATFSTGTAALTIGGTAVDDAAVTQVTWSNSNGGATGTATGTANWSANLTLRSGVNVLTVTARDAMNNTATATLTATLDSTAPTVTITTPTTDPTRSTNVSALTLGGTASDSTGVTQVTWANDRGGSGTASGTTSWTANLTLQTGVNVLTVTARDAANNSSTDTLTVTLDMTAPVVTISSPTSASTFSQGAAALTLAGTASDSVGVTQVTWSNSNGGASGTATGTTSWSASLSLQAGNNVLTVTARDAAGNSSTDTLTVMRDSVNPVVTITTPTSNPTFAATSAALTLGGTASDNVGVTQVTWSNSNGGATGTATGTTNWSANLTLQAGTNVLTVTARDAANNAVTDTLTVTIDAVAPTVAITTPTSSATHTTTEWALAIGGTASDNLGVAQVSWSNDRGGSGTATGTATWSATATLQAGVNVLTVTARDTANNTSTDTLTVTYTATPGVTDTFTGTNGTLLTARPPNTSPGPWTVYSGAPVPVLQNGVLQSAGGSGYVVAAVESLLSDGVVAADFRSSATQPYVGLVFRAIDADRMLFLRYASGATNASVHLFQRVGGEFSLVGGVGALPRPAPGSLHRLEVRFVGAAIEAVLDSVTVLTTSSSAYQTATKHGVLWHAPSDSNATYDNFAVTTPTADTTGPAVTITTPTSAATFSTATAALSLAGMASDNVGVTQVAWSNNRGGSGTATGTTSWSANLTLQPGVNVLTVTARDAANNTSSGTLTVTLDTTAPDVTITTPTSNPTHATGAWAFSLGGTASDAVGVTQVTWSNDRGGSGTATGTTNWTANATLVPGVNVLTVTARDAANNSRTDSLAVTYTPALGVRDTFTGSNGTSLTAHAADVAPGAWTVHHGAPLPLLQDGTLRSAGGSGYVVATIESAMSDGVVGADFRSLGTPSMQYVGVVFRAVDSDQMLLLRYASSSTTGMLQLFERVGGSFALVTGTNTLPPGVPGALHRLEARFAGSGIEAVLDNVVVFTTASTRYQGATKHGLLWYAPSDTSATFDNFSVAPPAADTTNPTVTIATPTSSATFHTATTAVTVGGTASDNVGVTQVTWSNSNGGATGTATGTANWSANLTLQPGVNVLTVTARDAANNTSTGTLTVTLDTTAPAVTITAPVSTPTHATGAAALALGGSATDAVGVTQVAWSNNRGGSGTATLGGSATSATWTANLTLQPGVNVLTVTARDGANNTSTDTLTVTYTALGGVTDTFTGGDGTSLAGRTADVGPGPWTVHDGAPSPLLHDGAVRPAGGNGYVVATIESALSDGVVGADFRSASTAAEQFAGVVFRAVDANQMLLLRYASNSTRGMLQLFQRIGGSFTLLTGTSLPSSVAGSPHRLEARFTGTAIEAVLDGVVIFSTTSSAYQTATRHGLLWYTPSDATARYDNFTVTAPVSLDAAPPAVAIATPTSSATQSTTSVGLTLGGTATDGVRVADVSWRNDRGGAGAATLGGTATAATWNAAVTLAPGVNVLTVTARDASNNTVTDTLTVTYTPDTAVADSFNGANGTLLTQHAADEMPGGPWTVQAGASSPVLQDGALRANGGAGYVIATVDSLLSDGAVGADFRSLGMSGEQFAGVVFRAVDANRMLLLRYASSATAGVLQLFERVNGEFILVTGTNSLPAGVPGVLHRLEARFTGDAIQAVLDNEVIFTTRLSRYQTATQHGVLWYTPADSSVTFDNFTVAP